MKTERFIKIKTVNAEKQVVYGEVYAPNVLDTWGELMLPEDVELMAHRFMKMAHMKEAIDTQHDNIPNGSYPVESFIAREDDPDYTPGAWVLGVKITDSGVWDAVKSGKLNGYSFESLCRGVPAVIELEVLRDNFGITEETAGHSHMFFAEVGDNGVVVTGRTTTVLGHDHLISEGTATDESFGHAHRYFL